MSVEFTISFPPKNGREISPDFVKSLAARIGLNTQLGVEGAEANTTKVPPEIRIRAVAEDVRTALDPLLQAQGVLYIVRTP